ncbi:NADPH-adrenodoxin reductase [Metarhizium rileyi]|uniref:NADPH:adrenodoxin oxidoreductase, mitochondrial n=1 Tax=Metarhizium rileyi (strain RCEF 4871) TaxID=1649241 RepID=A0A5C6GH21_METRR|nr:NADPH-adrenodoxin reductase [Metarhizium rileyi]
MSKLPNAYVDMYESLPVPFGLVRHGVAPDHPEVKNCQEKFENIASSPRFRFIGNVSVGSSSRANEQGGVKLRTLMHHYDSVLFAYGASEDKKLGIPGESTLKGIYSARQFVGWYNGLPECSDLDPTLLNAQEVVIIGQGNVALDVARILLEDKDVLKKTDITEYALAKLSQSRVKRVHVVGRRGPVQAAFTIKEVRELMKLPSVAFLPVDRSLIPMDLHSLPRASKRLMGVILKGSEVRHEETAKSWSLDNCLSPRRFLGDRESPQDVARTEFNITKLTDTFNPSSEAIQTDQILQLPSEIVFRSVGYKSVALPEFAAMGIQFDESRGIVKNDGLGRVTQSLAADQHMSISRHVPGLYCAGWVKRGPTGVIASTMQDAFITAEAIVQDWVSGAKFLRPKGSTAAQGWDGVRQDSNSHLERRVSWDQWLQIDRAEKQGGKRLGKEREKFTNIQDMLAIIQ